MKPYPNLRKRLAGKAFALTLVFGLLGFGCLSGGIAALADPGIDPEDTYLSQMEEIAKRQGRALSPDERARYAEMDRQQARGFRQLLLAGAAAQLAAGLAFGAGAVFFARWDVRKTRLAKQAARYAAHLGEEDPEGALAELERELAAPVYDTPQLALTRNWVLGQAGALRRAAAIPLGAVVGVYDNFSVSRWNGRVHYAYGLLLADKFDERLILQLRGRKQLDEAYRMLVRAVPHALRGNGEDDYYKGFCRLPGEEREARLQSVLAANARDGLAHWER